jgi:hypothetical protein
MVTTTTKPEILPVNSAGVPDTLKSIAQWVVWRLEFRNEKWTKVPYQAATGQRAASTDPETWTTFDAAIAAYETGDYSGIGFVFTSEDEFAGVDLDHCIRGDEYAEWAVEIAAEFQTYVEISPSGTGLHVLMIGTKPRMATRPGEKEPCKKTGFPNDGAVEVYETGRYLAITGRALPDFRPDVEDCQSALTNLCHKLFKKEQPPPAAAPMQHHVDDQAVISKVRSKPDFDRLWQGDPSGYDNDESRADLALCGRIAFFCGDDPNRIDRVFRTSGLVREKWTGRADYRDRTIQAAVSGCKDFYRWNGDATSAPIGKQWRDDSQLCEVNDWTIHDVSSSDFNDQEFTHVYLIDDVLVKGEPTVIGGFLKTLKTSIAVDMGVSMACSRKFLGRFWSQPARVGIISGESGQYVLQETARRICRSKGVNLADANLWWYFKVPPITNSAARKAIVEWIKRRELDVLILDPLYLSFCGIDIARNASNVYAMGTVFGDFGEVCKDTGVTLVLVHHTSRTANRSKGFEPATLDDLAFAGLSEFAASWLMLARRSQYLPGSGTHELWLTTGGRAGHGGLFGLDVTEGSSKDQGGRVWQPSILNYAEARESIAAAKGNKRQEQDRALQTELLAALQTPASQSELMTRTGWDSRKLNRIVGQMPRFVEVIEDKIKGQKCKLYRKTIHAN